MSQNSQGVLFKTLLHLSPSNKKIKSYQSNLPFCLLRIHLLPCFLFSFFTGCCSEAVKAHYHLGFFHEILPLFGFCSLSRGCTPFWNYEQTAQSSCDNHSSILWEVPPARNTGPAGLDSAFEVLLQTDVIKSHSPCGEWEIPKKLEETSENLND